MECLMTRVLTSRRVEFIEGGTSKGGNLSSIATNHRFFLFYGAALLDFLHERPLKGQLWLSLQEVYLYVGSVKEKANMKATTLIAALIIVMATGPTHAGFISSVVPSLETTVGTTLDAVVDATPVTADTTADTTLGITVETTPETTGEITFDSTATVSVPPPGLLSDDMIASLNTGLGADTIIGSVDGNADLNIGLNTTDNGLNGNKIPEPGTILLVSIGLAVLLTRRDKRSARNS